jgi:nucleoside diphosphate kinase
MSGMNTGICKKTALGLTALMVLSACSEGPVFDLMQKTGKAKPMPPLIKAQMVEGAVTLVPPLGYCIDPSSLTQTFALMARCDLLNAENGALDAPIGLITASLAKSRGQLLSAADVAHASNANVVETLEKSGLKIVRAETLIPPNGLAKTHYRTTTQIDGFDLSLALFSPIESEAQGSLGASMLQNIVKTSQDASIATAVASGAPSKTSASAKGFRTTIASLFE